MLEHANSIPSSVTIKVFATIWDSFLGKKFFDFAKIGVFYFPIFENGG